MISVTCDVDTEQLGRYSIEALTAYQKDGRTNSYYNVDINFLDKNVVREMRRKGCLDEAVALERFFTGQ